MYVELRCNEVRGLHSQMYVLQNIAVIDRRRLKCKYIVAGSDLRAFLLLLPRSLLLNKSSQGRTFRRSISNVHHTFQHIGLHCACL